MGAIRTSHLQCLYKKCTLLWQCLWLSWQSGHFPTPEVRSRFESSRRRIFIHLFTINCIEKTKKKKEVGNGPFLKTRTTQVFPRSAYLHALHVLDAK